jgi:hypothetical protein
MFVLEPSDIGHDREIMINRNHWDLEVITDSKYIFPVHVK